MNLYLLSQTALTGYDVFDSAVVTAENDDAARLMHPDERENWDGKAGNYPAWPDAECISVVYLGIAHPSLKSGVICASFNAG